MLYQTPPQVIADIVDAPLTPGVSLSSDKKWMLLLERQTLPSIEELAQPELRLAGYRINPKNNAPSRTPAFTDMILVSLPDGAKRTISGLPENPRIRNVQWSPDSSHIAFTQDHLDSVTLWIVSVDANEAKRLSDLPINDTFGASPYTWHTNSRSLFVLTVPPDRGDPPQPAHVPSGPIIQQSMGKNAAARTYQDLLQNIHDEAQFDYYFTSAAARMDLEGTVSDLNQPAVFSRMEPSPNSEYLLVEKIHRPYSYRVPAYRFPVDIEVWSADGQVVHQITSRPLAEDIPIAFEAVVKGPRDVRWRGDAPATVVWAEAQDEGDPRLPAEVRDAIYSLETPFDGEPTVLARFAERFKGILWGDDDLALAYERWWDTRNERLWRLYPGQTDREQSLIYERSCEDRYQDPGMAMTAPNEWDRNVLLQVDEDVLLLRGDGASPEGDRPFLDRFDLSTGNTQRLWQSQAPYYQRIVSPLDETGNQFLIARESEQEPTNYFILDLEKNGLSALTDFPHPTPALKNIQKQLITYQREDGVTLSAYLYLPPDYDPQSDGPLPTFLWAYPREFKSADAAGQISGSPYQFNRVSYAGPLFLTALGYAVIDRAAMPILGEGDREPNDTYVQQLVASAKAAIDKAAEMGVTDPGRVAVGGHSYGAFMAVNLLAHSDLFRAGVARSGAYNRSLTPFGFQAEQRTLWEVPDIYLKMSPFFHAGQIKEPLLLIHGEVDNNSGTFPVQSERLYQALQGLGGIVRYVLLPHESHGYQARESVLHMMWETINWLDSYVKTPNHE